VTYHLTINQTDEMPTLPDHLPVPVQVQVDDVKVNGIPTFLTENPTDKTHSIVA